MTTLSESKEQRWRQALVQADASLHDAISNLSKSGLQIVLATDSAGRLLGTLTDGDLRRGLLRGLSMDSSIDSIINREPLVVPPDLGRDAVLQIMQANRIHQLPIVDATRQVVGLSLLDELLLPSRRPNLMVIMAGGQGMRLRPHTNKCPKPLLPVNGKPILQHIIERAKSDGFQHFALAINYLGEMIKDHFGDGSALGVKIDYLQEDSPLGTAGALSLLPQRPDSPLLITNGDVITDVSYGDLLDFHQRHNAAATMAVRLHEWRHPYGVVKTKGVELIDFEEKPVYRSHINAGIYVLEPDTLDELVPDQRCDMPTLFSAVKRSGNMTIVYPTHEPWLDVGNPDDYVLANSESEST